MSEPLVEVVCGCLVDAIHRGDLTVVDSDGNLRASVGDPRGKIAYSRSAAKPVQALPLISSGAAERWGFTPRDLALVAGSHNGEPVHVSHASALLAKVGGNVGDLTCGTHLPLDPDSAADVLRGQEQVSPLHNNCSGKHIGMLALAAHLGATRVGYTSADHPVQAAILDAVCSFSALEPDAVMIGTDGCGVLCYGTSVYHLALAFARLMNPVGVSERYAEAAHGIRAAMAGGPRPTARRGRTCRPTVGDGSAAAVVDGGLGRPVGQQQNRPRSRPGPPPCGDMGAGHHRQPRRLAACPGLT